MIGGDAAAGADEQHLGGQWVGQGELTLDLPQAHDLAGPNPVDQIGRHDAAVDPLRRHADQAVLGSGLRGQRIGPPVEAAVDDQAQAHVLARLVTRPFVAWTDQHTRRLRTTRLDSFDLAAQFSGRPQRVEHLQVIIGAQRFEQETHRPQEELAPAGNGWPGTAFCHTRDPFARMPAGVSRTTLTHRCYLAPRR